MSDQVLQKTEKAMQGSLAALERDYKRLRTGRATPSLVEHIRVQYYGSETPLSQLASIAAPEPRQLVIKPFDASAIADIEKAVAKSDLGINPQSDGKVIRLNIPPLSEETRKKLVHETKKLLENAKVSVRNSRRDANRDLDAACKDKTITEDVRDTQKDKIQDLTKSYEGKLDKMQADKEKELLTV